MSLGGDASGWATAFQSKEPDAPSVGALNMFFYSNSAVDQLFVEVSIVDETVRLAKYREEKYAFSLPACTPTDTPASKALHPIAGEILQLMKPLSLRIAYTPYLGTVPMKIHS